MTYDPGCRSDLPRFTPIIAVDSMAVLLRVCLMAQARHPNGMMDITRGFWPVKSSLSISRGARG